MKYLSTFCLLTLLLFIVCCHSDNNNSNTQNTNINTFEGNNSENLPEVFKDYPEGIEVDNEPDTIYADINENGPKKYIWKHTTTIKATKSDLRIIEFGTYNFKNGKWILGDYTKKPFITADFDKWYCRKKNGIITFDYCENGNILKDVEYIDPTNYCIRMDSLVNRKGLWYYIGTDSSGNKFMGYGRYVVVGKMKN